MCCLSPTLADIKLSYITSSLHFVATFFFSPQCPKDVQSLPLTLHPSVFICIWFSLCTTSQSQVISLFLFPLLSFLTSFFLHSRFAIFPLSWLVKRHCLSVVFIQSTASSAEDDKSQLSMRPQTPVGEGEEGSEVDGQVVWNKVAPLPTPEEKMRQTAKAVPTDIVAINVTGMTSWLLQSSNQHPQPSTLQQNH